LPLFERTARLQSLEVLLDEPAPSVELDDTLQSIGRADVFACEKHPLDSWLSRRWFRLPDSHDIDRELEFASRHWSRKGESSSRNGNPRGATFTLRVSPTGLVSLVTEIEGKWRGGEHVS
jgi:hypothetical protein